MNELIDWLRDVIRNEEEWAKYTSEENLRMFYLRGLQEERFIVNNCIAVINEDNDRAEFARMILRRLAYKYRDVYGFVPEWMENK